MRSLENVLVGKGKRDQGYLGSKTHLAADALLPAECAWQPNAHASQVQVTRYVCSTGDGGV